MKPPFAFSPPRVPLAPALPFNSWVRIVCGGGCGTVGRITRTQHQTKPRGIRYQIDSHLGWVSDWQLEAFQPSLFRRIARRFFTY